MISLSLLSASTYFVSTFLGTDSALCLLRVEHPALNQLDAFETLAKESRPTSQKLIHSWVC